MTKISPIPKSGSIEAIQKGNINGVVTKSKNVTKRLKKAFSKFLQKPIKSVTPSANTASGIGNIASAGANVIKAIGYIIGPINILGGLKTAYDSTKSAQEIKTFRSYKTAETGSQGLGGLSAIAGGVLSSIKIFGSLGSTAASVINPLGILTTSFLAVESFTSWRDTVSKYNTYKETKNKLTAELKKIETSKENKEQNINTAKDFLNKLPIPIIDFKNKNNLNEVKNYLNATHGGTDKLDERFTGILQKKSDDKRFSEILQNNSDDDSSLTTDSITSDESLPNTPRSDSPLTIEENSKSSLNLTNTIDPELYTKNDLKLTLVKALLEGNIKEDDLIPNFQDIIDLRDVFLEDIKVNSKAPPPEETQNETKPAYTISALDTDGIANTYIQYSPRERLDNNNNQPSTQQGSTTIECTSSHEIVEHATNIAKKKNDIKAAVNEVDKNLKIENKKYYYNALKFAGSVVLVGTSVAVAVGAAATPVGAGIIIGASLLALGIHMYTRHKLDEIPEKQEQIQVEKLKHIKRIVDLDSTNTRLNTTANTNSQNQNLNSEKINANSKRERRAAMLLPNNDIVSKLINTKADTQLKEIFKNNEENILTVLHKLDEELTTPNITTAILNGHLSIEEILLKLLLQELKKDEKLKLSINLLENEKEIEILNEELSKMKKKDQDQINLQEKNTKPKLENMEQLYNFFSDTQTKEFIDYKKSPEKNLLEIFKQKESMSIPDEFLAIKKFAEIIIEKSSPQFQNIAIINEYLTNNHPENTRFEDLPAEIQSNLWAYYHSLPESTLSSNTGSDSSIDSDDETPRTVNSTDSDSTTTINSFGLSEENKTKIEDYIKALNEINDDYKDKTGLNTKEIFKLKEILKEDRSKNKETLINNFLSQNDITKENKEETKQSNDILTTNKSIQKNKVVPSMDLKQFSAPKLRTITSLQIDNLKKYL